MCSKYHSIPFALLRSIHSLIHKVARCTHCVLKPQCTGHDTEYVLNVMSSALWPNTVCIVCRKSVSQFLFQCVIQTMFQFYFWCIFQCVPVCLVVCVSGCVSVYFPVCFSLFSSGYSSTYSSLCSNVCFSVCKGLCSSAAVRLDSNYYETCHRCEVGQTSTALVSQLARNIIIIIIILILIINLVIAIIIIIILPNVDNNDQCSVLQFATFMPLHSMPVQFCSN